MKIKVGKEFRLLFAEKLMDLGNIAVAALVFGQFISGREVSIHAIITGVIFCVACYIISLILSRK